MYLSIKARLIFATGDGKADLLCISRDGTVNGWLNKGLNNFQSAGLLFSNVAERASIRFADINGDVSFIQGRDQQKPTNQISKGRADLLALDPVTGAADALVNGGPGGNGNETYSWWSQGTVFPGGYMRGECIHFAK